MSEKLKQLCDVCPLHSKYEELVQKNLELVRELEIAREEMYLDKLTNIPNRRFFMDVHIGAHAHAIRRRNQYCLAMIDIDHFKTINDKYGHGVGDQVLVAFGKQLNAMKRVDDTVARWGGEEFVILMPDTRMYGAERLMERILEHSRKIRIKQDGYKISLTVSIGVTEWKKFDSIDELIHRADTALYTAKGGGRNCIRVG